MWLDPARSGQNLVWRQLCPPDIIAYLFFSTNMEEKITNSNLELAALILHEATLLAASRTDNIPTVSWSTHEASTINLVVTGLLNICALHSRNIFLNPSVFITRVKKIAWRTMPLVFSIVLIPQLLPTCLFHTQSHTVHGRSTPHHWNCFPE